MSTGWTSRLKRKGGLQAIEARRLVEVNLIKNHKPRNASEAELLPGVLAWLLENPVRTLPVLTKEFFGWAERPAFQKRNPYAL